MKKTVSIIIPCLNEEKYIEGCLESLIENDYDKKFMEIIVIDAMSQDHTREILSKYCKRYDFIKVLDNPKRITPAALNLGIKASTFDIIVRADAHSIYDKNYVSTLVDGLDKYNVDNIGGVRDTCLIDDTNLTLALSISVSHPFSAGNAYYRTGTDVVRVVDTVFCGCFRRDLFNKIGYFNENIIRTEDRDFNARILANNGKIILIPYTRCTYHPRIKLWEYCKWNTYGPFRLFYNQIYSNNNMASLRNLIPMAFILTQIIAIIGYYVSFYMGILFSIPFLLYLLIASLLSIKVAFEFRRFFLAPTMLFVFALIHYGYGFGSMCGLPWYIVGLLRMKRRNISKINLAKSVISASNIKTVTIIIPCRNEEKYIARCLDSLLLNDYPREFLSIVIVDGMSTDSTRQIVSEYSKQYKHIILLDNQQFIKPAALNIGIKATQSDIVMRVDAHAIYARDYISTLVNGIQEYNVDNIGGVRETDPGQGLIENAISIAISNSFAVGNAYWRTGTRKVREVDTVFGGCYPRDIFDRIGYFNEKLIRAQDREFNARLKMAGGSIIIDPAAKILYFPRNTLTEYFKWNLSSAFWLFYSRRFTSGRMILWRNIVPLVFVIWHFLLPFALVLPRGMGFFLLLPILTYWVLNAILSIGIAFRRRKILMMPIMMFFFAVTHYGYGLGGLCGLIGLNSKSWRYI